MQIIEIIYSISALVAISACLPQIRQLVISKASDELNLGTWVTWLMTQCITLTYVVAIGNVLMTMVNVAWVSFYAVMVGLILYYRKGAQSIEVPRQFSTDEA